MSIEHKDRKEYRATYIREHYQKNKQYYLDKAVARRIQLQDIIREAKNKPCTDCKIKYPYYVMQFDHLVDVEKLFELSTAHVRGYSEKKITEEIAKCEVVCANCHAIRTYTRRAAVV